MDILSLLAFICLAIFLTYFLCIFVPYLRHRPASEGDVSAWTWHAVIPCLNEEATVVATVTRLSAQYPNMEIWAIDDDSDDATYALLTDLAESMSRLHIVARRQPHAREGKGPALNAAYREISAWAQRHDVDRERQILVVVDADGQLSDNACAIAAGPEGFANPRVGAVQLCVEMINRDDPTPLGAGAGRWANAFAALLVRMQDIEFRTTIAAMQFLRKKTVSVGLGGNGQLSRLSALDAIAERAGTPWHDALLEDYELGLHVKLAGYRNEYLHEGSVKQEAVTSVGRYIRQRARWAQGGMQCAKYVPSVVASNRFTNIAMIETLYFMCMPFLQVLGIVLWPTLFVMYFIVMVNTFSFAVLEAAAWLIPATIVTGILPFAIWPLAYRREEPTPLLRALRWGLCYWLYIYLSYPVCALAFVNFVRGKRTWAKTERNAALNPA